MVLLNGMGEQFLLLLSV